MSPSKKVKIDYLTVSNSLFAKKALSKEYGKTASLEIYEALSSPENGALRNKVISMAKKNGMISLDDTSGTNIDVQIFDTAKLGKDACCFELNDNIPDDKKPVIFVMDYTFGEQAYETIDEFLKPYKKKKVLVA